MPVFAAELFVGVGYALPVIKSSSSIYSQSGMQVQHGTLIGRNKIKHSGLNVTGGAIFARKHRLSITLQDLAKKKYAEMLNAEGSEGHSEVLNVEGEVVALSYDYLLNFGLYFGVSAYQSKLKSGTERDYMFIDSLRVGYILKITEESAVSLLLTNYSGYVSNEPSSKVARRSTNSWRSTNGRRSTNRMNLYSFNNDDYDYDYDYHFVTEYTNIVLLSIVYTYTFGRRVLKTD